MDIFSNLQVVGECLFDQKRTNAFKKAIFNVVKLNDTVLDAGTGSGIMALFSAKAGAKKVYGIEIAPDIVNIAKENVNSNGFENIEITNGDITAIDIDKPIDVVIMEMLDTGLIAEQQTQAINHLIKTNIINKNTKTIPIKLESYIELLEYDFDFYDFKMPFIIQARNYGVNKHINKLMSKKTKYDSVMFNDLINEKVEERVSIKTLCNGSVNAIRISSKIFLSPEIKFWGTSDVCMPVIIPINTINVNKDQTILLDIKYKRSYGFDNVQLSLKV